MIEDRNAIARKSHEALAKTHRAAFGALFAVLLAACGAAPAPRSDSQSPSSAQELPPKQQKTSLDSVEQFLLTSAATDFRAHNPPTPSRFRAVRIGHVMTPSGDAQYMLCGEFLPIQEGGKAAWTPFATIKTSGYEQWIGAQSAAFCQGPSVIWDEEGDLSSSLQSKFDSLR